ncbi:MAG: thioredoxin family protein [Dehalococcoidia bacterium]|nr:thioredoxin family protein [Dehalococcoidia bacterium]
MITVACDAKGAEAAAPFITAANPSHPSLIDRHHAVPELYNTRNVPAAFWIDEAGRIVRANDPIYIQRRNRETGETTINEQYLNAVRDWVKNGSASIYVTPPAETARRMGALDAENAEANAHFRLGFYLHEQGHTAEAIAQFKRAHALKPDNWNYKRQAWNLGNIEQDYGMTTREAFAGGIPLYPPLELPQAPAG